MGEDPRVMRLADQPSIFLGTVHPFTARRR
jgi:hypothetical protein